MLQTTHVFESAFIQVFTLTLTLPWREGVKGKGKSPLIPLFLRGRWWLLPFLKGD